MEFRGQHAEFRSRLDREVGGRVACTELDLVTEAVEVQVDGSVVDSATGAAIMGHPGEALALAANELARRGHAIESGWIVLTGGMTDAVFAPRGCSIELHFTNLGSVRLAGGA